MDAKLKVDWLAALRSGEFEQTTQVLHQKYSKDAYCCLGVLCVVAGGKFQDWKTMDDAAVLNGCMIGDSDDACLTNDFAKEISISKDELRQLIELNDGFKDKDAIWHESKSFLEIADWIETHL